jgi:hypothetical protein
LIYKGSALIKVGHCQQKLGQIERDFIGTAANCYVQPLRKFLDGEMKTISKEISILEIKRYYVIRLLIKIQKKEVIKFFNFLIF